MICSGKRLQCEVNEELIRIREVSNYRSSNYRSSNYGIYAMHVWLVENGLMLQFLSFACFNKNCLFFPNIIYIENIFDYAYLSIEQSFVLQAWLENIQNIYITKAYSIFSKSKPKIFWKTQQQFQNCISWKCFAFQ